MARAGMGRSLVVGQGDLVAYGSVFGLSGLPTCTDSLRIVII